jgi:hypothetical protein
MGTYLSYLYRFSIQYMYNIYEYTRIIYTILRHGQNQTTKVITMYIRNRSTHILQF